MQLEKIIVAIDDDENIMVKIADFLSVMDCKDAEIIAVNVIKEPALLSDALKEKAEEIYFPLSAQLLNKLEKKIKVKGFKNIQVKSIVGDPAKEILKLAKETSAEAIVVGLHEKGALTEFLIGSVSSKLVHHAKCTVIVVR